MKTILICGAGVAGLTLAECLCRQGYRPLIVERAGVLRDGFMLDFSGPGVCVADRLGLRSALEAIHVPVANVTVMDGEGHGSSVPYQLLRERLFNGRHFNVMRGDLQRALHSRVGRQCEIRFGVTIAAVESRPRSVLVRLSDGTIHDVDMLVGADGAHSVVRRLVFGPDARFTRPLGYYAAACTFECVSASIDPRDAIVTMAVPHRQVSLYPVPGGDVAASFLYRPNGNPDRVWSRNEICRGLQAAYCDLGGFLPELLAHCATARDLHFGPVEQIHMRRWHIRRTVLVGDACQCPSPLAGQGASMAMMGAFVLAEELRSGSDLQTAMDKYERRMQPIVAREQKAARRMARWFVPASLPRVRLRNLAFRWSAAWHLTSIVRRRMAAGQRAWQLFIYRGT